MQASLRCKIMLACVGRCRRVTAVPEHKLAVSTDGVQKAVHFANAGHAQAGIEPSTSSYLGTCAAGLVQDYDDGKFTSAAAEAAARSAAAEEERDEATAVPGSACATALTCNRSIAHRRTELDRVGLIAVVCAHVFAGFNLVVPMLTPEQHYFYDVVLSTLLIACPHLHAIYLDLACRYGGRFRRLLKRLVDEDRVGSQVLQVLLKLPWMHAFDHSMVCQLLNSGMFQVGAGRRVGEMTEALWALLKPFTKLARFMTLARWHDGYNLALAHLMHVKLANFVDLLQSKRAKNTTKLGERRR
jgi:hypothetical protein